MAAPKTPEMTEAERLAMFSERMMVAKAPAWMPAPGDVMVATVIGLSMREGDYDPYPCVTYRKDDGSVVNVHAFHTLLRERLAELKTNMGSKHILTYNGTRDKNQLNAKGETESYHDYYVEDYNAVMTQPIDGTGAFSFTVDKK